MSQNQPLNIKDLQIEKNIKKLCRQYQKHLNACNHHSRHKKASECKARAIQNCIAELKKQLSPLHVKQKEIEGGIG